MYQRLPRPPPQEFLRRNWLPATAALVAGLGLLGGAVGFAWQARIADGRFNQVRKLATVAGIPFFVRWSPDGRRLRFSVSGAGDTSSSLWESWPRAPSW